MKTLSVLLLFGLSTTIYAQQECVDLSGYTNAYLNNVNVDNTTYPAGTAFITSGNIQYIKPALGNFYQGIVGDSLFYVGDIDIDVSNETCPNKTLIFSAIYLEGLAVDGDTIFTTLNPPATYSGNGFQFEHLGGEDYMVTGDFDVVSLYSSTNFLFDVCLECEVETITDCVSLDQYDASYLNDVTYDNVTYPPGTAFITSGNIQYIKPSTGNFYQGIQGDSLFYIGDLDIDVSNETCPNKTLIFSAIYLEGLAVDGDTIFASLNPPATYSGNGFQFEHLGGEDYMVTGDFDVVSLYSSTNFLFDVCLSCEVETTINCVSLDQYDVSYLNDVTYDNVTYPPGTAFITSGNIQYIKPSTGNFYQGIQGDSLFYIGDIDIDVSNETCPNKTLIFSAVYLEGLAVDGDTIFTTLNPPATYSGNGFQFEHLGGEDYMVTGDFDVVSLYSSTNFLFDVCLSCEVETTINCVSLDQYDVSYLNGVTYDNVTYPPGTAFITSGNIQYIKPSTGNIYQGIQGDSLFYIGDLDIDVSLDSCARKTLHFSCVYLEGVAVDGVDIFTTLNPPTYFAGNGFEFEFDGNQTYTVSGDFDVVSLFSSTNFLFDVCLECEGFLSTPEIVQENPKMQIYPNPTTGIFTISGPIDGYSYEIVSSQGKYIQGGRSFDGQKEIDLSRVEVGFYILSIQSSAGAQSVERIVIVD